jgi:tetratricopeptide (TPR) repeat protein
VLPVSILSAIRQRLTRLATETVDVLRVAAIVGRTFELSLLAQVRDEEVEVVEERLLEGVGARLIRPEGTASYAFTHDKIRECLYAEVSGARSRRLHEVIGRALEERYRQAASENRLTHVLADLAFHFARSGDLERGITYSVKAAGQAQQSYAFEEALIQYQTALDLLDPIDRRRGDLLLRLGEVMLSAGREGEAAAIFETAHGLLIQSQSEGHRPVAAAQVAICGILANAYFARTEIERSRHMTLMRMEFAHRCHQPYELRHVHSWLALICILQGEWVQAEQMIGQAQSIVEKLADDEPLAVLLRKRGLLAYHRDRFQEAERWFEEALAITRPKGPQHVAWYLGLLALTRFALGKRREVLVCMAELENVVAALPAQSLPTAPALTELMEIALWMGDSDRAERYYPQLRAFEGQMFHSMVDPALGAFETARGNWAAAKRTCRGQRALPGERACNRCSSESCNIGSTSRRRGEVRIALPAPTRHWKKPSSCVKSWTSTTGRAGSAPSSATCAIL